MLGKILSSIIPKFKPLEEALIKELLDNVLITDTKAKLKSQIEGINHVQRLSDGKEVDLYCMRGGKPYRDDSQRVVAPTVEFKFASISFKPSNTNEKLKVDFWLVEGMLFSLTFSKSPKPYLSNAVIFVEEVKFYNRDNNIRMGDVNFLGILKEWSNKYNVRGIKPPLTESSIKSFVFNQAINFPAGYLDLIGKTDGCDVNAWHVLGLMEIRQIVLEDKNYWIIAEADNIGVLAIIDSKQSDNIYFLDFDGSEPQDMGRNFEDVMEEIIKKNK